MQDHQPVHLVLFDDCLIRVPDPALLPKQGAFLLARHLPLRTSDRVLELGAGAGLVAIAAARRGHPVIATDILDACCATLRMNAVLNGAACLEVRQGDLFAPVAGEAFDLIAANPPQMPTPPEHRWEDAAAVADNGGPDGWAILERIILEAPAHLKPGGRLVFTLFDFLGLPRALDRLRAVDLAGRVIAAEVHAFPRAGRDRLAYLRALDGAACLGPGCPTTCTRLLVCGERA